MFNTAPEEALTALSRHHGSVMVDLDETLFLRNSTEEFINCAIPGLPALLLMRFLDFLRPWRWTGGEVTRDVWRVRCVLMFFPWTLLVWKRRVKGLSAAHLNVALATALKEDRLETIIVTVGFQIIVSDLVKALGFGNVRIIAASLADSGDRRRGKLAMAMNTLGGETIRRSLFVTDSLDDKPLLEKCAMPLRVIWPKAAYEQALSRVYLPGQYVSRVKRPGERYIFRGILQEDFAFWVLCSIELGQHPVFHILGLGFLLVSFWAIYERGYVDNDFVAAKFEDAPKLSNNFWLTSVATPKLLPWIWAAVTGAAAIWLLRAMQPIQLLDAAKWSAVLIGTYLWFRLYNRYDKMTRTWMFGGLQFLRSAAFLVLVPCELMGVAALGAHVLSRWVPYFLYRFGGNSWPNNITQTIRLMFFLVLALLFMMAAGASVILNWTTALILSWNLFRARKELPDLLKSAKRIDKNTTK